MATFKHISSKNADYGAAEQYLTFEHDEFTMKPTLDEAGRLVPREDYRISTLNCGGEDFAVACMRSNLRYGKNQEREDVKSHHYIISFDPRDGPDNGLTVDRAQELGMEYAAKHFPGHQALVCTHPDGHNHSGNIHVHIVINSLRIEDVPTLPYMDRPADTKAGCKHRCTGAAMEYFKAEVMEMCHRERLYQIDLLHSSKNRVTEREYWARKKGQAKLDKENAALAAEGQPVKPTKFETDKEKLRQTIRRALAAATSYEEYATLLLRQGVTVKESRGRLSYLTPDRAKPITARKLGDDFDRAAVLAVLEQNSQKAVVKRDIPAAQGGMPQNVPHRQTAAPPVKRGILDQLKQAQGVQRMVDREVARQKGVGYDRWAAVHNLKQMAQTHNFLTENGMLDLDRLDEAITAASAEAREARAVLKDCEARLKRQTDLRTAATNYRQTKPVVDKLKDVKPKKRESYRRANESDFFIHEAAKRQLSELLHGRKLTSRQAIQAGVEALVSEKNAAYNDYREKSARLDELMTVKRNAEQILKSREPKRARRHEHER